MQIFRFLVSNFYILLYTFRLIDTVKEIFVSLETYPDIVFDSKQDENVEVKKFQCSKYIIQC